MFESNRCLDETTPNRQSSNRTIAQSSIVDHDITNHETTFSANDAGTFPILPSPFHLSFTALYFSFLDLLFCLSFRFNSSLPTRCIFLSSYNKRNIDCNQLRMRKLSRKPQSQPLVLTVDCLLTSISWPNRHPNDIVIHSPLNCFP